MGRKRGFDEKKISAILGVLLANQDGMWIRRIALETGLAPNTVRYYVASVLQPLVEDTALGGGGKPLLRVIRLKPFVIERLQQGQDINQIMKFMKLLNKMGQ